VLFGASATIYGIVVTRRCSDAIAAQKARLREYREPAKRLRMRDQSQAPAPDAAERRPAGKERSPAVPRRAT